MGRIITWSIIGVIVIVIVFLFMQFQGNGPNSGPYSKVQIHWHATLKVFICGEEKQMPVPIGQSHLGTPLLHTHEDRRIHIEGTVWKPEDITMGKYMDAIGLNFRDDQLLDKKNGDLCSEQPGKVKLFVNKKESPELANYIIKEGDNYELRFEP